MVSRYTANEWRQKGVKSVYVAGPMSGKRGCNFEAFDEAAADLRRVGFKVTSPAEMDDDETRALSRASENCGPEAMKPGETWEKLLARDLRIVIEVDAVVTLPGWTKSRGANLEVAIAKSLAKPALLYPSLNPVRALPRLPYEEDSEE